MRQKVGWKMLWAVVLAAWLVPGGAVAGTPAVTEITVTDVTTRSFSVIWKASEAATADLLVSDYDQAITSCVAPPTPYPTTPHPLIGSDPSIKTVAEDAGIMKVMVTGLAANTAYCFQTVTTAKDANNPGITTEPAAPTTSSPYLVTTQDLTVRTYVGNDNGTPNDPTDDTILPFSNDLLHFPVYLPDQATVAAGSLLIGETAGSSAPVSGFVGDGIAAPAAMLDLNNLFLQADGMNQDLVGSEIIILREFRPDNQGTGPESATLVHYRRVPTDNELAEIKQPENCYLTDLNCDDVVNILDVQSVVNLFGKTTGFNVFNPDADVAADGTINILDVQSVVNRFGDTAPF